MVGTIELFGGANVLVHWFEPALYVFILGFVEVLELLGLVCGFVEGYWAVAISLSRGVGSDELDFALGLELCR